ncbi:MAG: GspE/PulE family protein [Patescibacteria group bacterium]
MANPPTPQTKREEELEKKLGQIQAHGSTDTFRTMAQKLGVPFSDLASAPIDTGALGLVSEADARAGNFAIILKTGTALTVATTDPAKIEGLETILALKTRGFTIQVIMTSPAGLAHAWQRYINLKRVDTFEVGSIDIKEEDLAELQKKIGSVKDLQQQVASVSVTKLLEILLAGALKIGASDIHFEPTHENARLRYRLDGVLKDVTTIEKESYEKIVNRIKILSHLKLNIQRAPQDGRFTIREGGIDIEVRVSILPSEFGETIVMRLLDPRSIKGKLEDLGMRPDFLEMMKEQLAKPTGAILTTGPTGSGKTTTLYAFVNYLNSSESKIITIEDPIEYHITGISQTQVDPTRGYGFADGLRSIVRQDPDIILVGEIRDNETAEIALNAALTGHLVLSTIHTNDAAGTIPRLIDLKVQPQIIAPAIRLAMAQRLLRRLCENCRAKKPLAVGRLEKIKTDLKPIAEKFPPEAGQPLADKIKTLLEVYEPVGCDKCNNTGYKGRIGVYEAFHVTPEMEKLIMSNPSMASVTELAVQQGMITMRQDAYLKLLEGVTSFDEIERILG